MTRKSDDVDHSSPEKKSGADPYATNPLHDPMSQSADEQGQERCQDRSPSEKSVTVKFTQR